MAGNKKPFLIVAPNVVPTGGMDRANMAVAEHVAKLGIELHIVAYSVHPSLLEYPHVTHHKVGKILTSETLSEPLIDHTGRKHAREVSRRGGRVMVNGGNCRWNDVNWVHHVHHADSAFAPPMLLQAAKRHIDYSLACFNEKRFVPLATTVITTCQRTKRDIVELLKVPEEKVKPVYLGMNNDLFKPVSDETRNKVRQENGWDANQRLAIFVGALGNRRKGFDTLFETWKHLNNTSDWDVKLLVVGRGAEVGFWQEKISQTGLEGKIELMGFVEDLASLVASCDIFVMPSRYEGYSLAAKEAVVSMVPAITTEKAGFAERYPENLRQLIMHDPDSVEELCQILRHWRENMHSYKQRIIPFAESLRNYNWDDMAEKMWEVICESPNPNT